MGTIDVSRQVAEMEQVLRSRTVGARRGEVLAVLERWQWDEMLDGDSRRRARQLLREFGASGGAGALWPAPYRRAPTLRAPAAPVAAPPRSDGAAAPRPGWRLSR